MATEFDEVDASLGERRGEWFHQTWNSESDPNWRDHVLAWLGLVKPEIEDIHGSISLGKDTHLWAKRGHNDRRMYLNNIPGSYAVAGVLQLLDSGNGVEIGYNLPGAGTDPVMWTISYTPPE
jgi:hypothetical protein